MATKRNSTSSTTPGKSKLPLFLHASGQWAKKIRGKMHYFGKDLDAALKRWVEEKDHLLAGVPYRRNDKRQALPELGDRFVADRKHDVTTGELAQRSLDEYIKSIRRLISIVGRECRLEDLSPLDFANIRQKLYEPVKREKAIRGGIKGRTVEQRSPITVGNDIRRLRVFFQWCVDNELTAAPRYGKNFAATSAKIARKARAAEGTKMLSAHDVHNIIAKASKGLRPIILLAMNAGIGQSDIANWKLNELPSKLSGECWIDLPRRKTGAPRRFLLWKETRDAIKAWLAIRPKPSADAADRVFLTRDGVAWVRENGGQRDDAVAKSFNKARKAANVKRGTFYDLRRTFQTIAAETLDFRAVSFIMGHVIPENDMPGRYTQAIGDDRIRAVCEHVRKWYLSGVDKLSRSSIAS